MSTDSAPFLRIEGLAKTYPGAAEAVFDSVNFGIQRGEFVCIIGHSGCGKTTILNVLAGLEKASEGYVFMDGREVAGPSLERGVVFQNQSRRNACQFSFACDGIPERVTEQKYWKQAQEIATGMVDGSRRTG